MDLAEKTPEAAEGQDVATPLRVRPDKIKAVTKLLMNSKYSLMDDLNYITSFPEYSDGPVASQIKEDGPDGEHSVKSEEARPIISIPRSTRIEAERVRIYIEYYYHYIDKSIGPDGSAHHHEGVEGVYNPLQVIRNRKLRKKYHEMPARQLFLQKAPIIAVNQFSKKPNKKLPWFVELGERASDLTWRTSHWDELVGPHGKLWFEPSKASSASPKKESHRYHRHHSKRRASSHVDLTLSSPYSLNGINPSSPELRTQHRGSTSDVSAVSHSELPVSHLATPEEVSSLDDGERSRLNRFEMMMNKTSKRWSKSPNLRRRSQSSIDKLSMPSSRGENYIRRTPAHSRASSSSVLAAESVPYMTPIENGNSQRTTLLSALPVVHARRPSQEKDNVQVEHVEASTTNSKIDDKDFDSVDPLDPAEKRLQTDEQLENLWADTKYIGVTLRMLQHRRITHSIVKSRGVQKRNKMQCYDSMDLIVNATSTVLNTYDEELNKALKKGNNLTSKILNDYSMRVETLISTSDRILSDINTSLTLKLKLFQENADRFGSLKMMRAQRLTKLFYGILEFAIVVFLWSVWFAVSLLKWMKLLVTAVFRIILWMLW
ncbi:hypothetical protein HG536_0C04260 [Torulaspora globosa]|uniref:Maintenance of telomere capping protein 4 n=1 Tax=Torulaspora globosa TaxID=48254 RepID=A0A7G3ZFH1_9SACH|nr:uncharacterized protein HG536_0C04260 [Torulaspora globosa]QLL32257.1 hypothetical protein HG536_0C04260 [Torulaspora globosa]